MRTKLLASVSALALAATIAACSDAPTSPAESASLRLTAPPCVLVGQPLANQTIHDVRQLFIFDLTTLVNENRLNCGQANSLLVHVEGAIEAAINGQCQVAGNRLASAAHQIDSFVEEEVLTDIEANKLRDELRAIGQALKDTGLCPDLDIRF